MNQSTADADRFERILRETQGQVRAHIAGMGVPAEDVDDVAQEVYLDFARDPGRVPAEIEVLRWLRGMARNCSLEYFRRRMRQAKHLTAIADLLAAEPEASGDDAHADQVQLDALRQCLERLEPTQRTLLETHYREGKPVALIADAQGRTAGAVHMVLARLRDALRRCLSERLGAAP